MTILHNDNTLERVMKARVELLTTCTFYGVLLGQVTPVVSDKVQTAATNGKQHYWNPDFVATLSQAKLVGVQVHENEHDARRHHTRRMGRDPKEWNIACDLAINPDVIAQGFKLPESALLDEKYIGMSAEDIYRSREIDRALEKQKQEQAKQEQEEQDETEDGLNQADTNPDGGTPNAGDETGDGDDGQDRESYSDDQDRESYSDETGDEAGDEGSESDQKSTGSNGGTQDGEPAGEASGEGDETAARDVPAGAGTDTGEAGNEAGEGEKTLSSAGDTGGCGEVLDASETSAELAAEDAKWETVLRQAAMLSAKRGEAPGHIARELEHADHPPQDWRETLRAFYDGGATTQETWSRPNRRLIGSGLYLPGRQRDGVNKAYFLIDTSGSVTYYPGALEAIKVETQAALDENIIDELVVVYGDTRVTRTDTYRSGDEIEFDPRGGGGTVMKPLFDYVRELADASLIVCFTDLEIEMEDQLGPEPECPVLWGVVGYPERVKQYLKATPWGAPGIEVVPSYT